jgi:hypothetical protein
MPAATETPLPAACGSHHSFRAIRKRLTIIHLPTKSITRGLTCVAAYNASECENGRSVGFASMPYPPVITRRVDHASNTPAPLPAAASPYHHFLFASGFSLSHEVAGFALVIGALPGSTLAEDALDETVEPLPLSASVSSSASVFTFGSGAAGADATSRSPPESFLESLELLEIPMGGFTAIFAVSPLCGMGNSNNTAASSMESPQSAASPANFSPLATRETLRIRSALRTGLLVTFLLVLHPGLRWDSRTSEILASF